MPSTEKLSCFLMAVGKTETSMSLVFASLTNTPTHYDVRSEMTTAKGIKQIPTFSERDHDQGSVHEDCVRQVLGNSHGLSLKEFYKTDT